MTASSWNMSRIICDRCGTPFEYESANGNILTKDWGEVHTQMKSGGTFAKVFSYKSDLCPTCVCSFIAWFSDGKGAVEK